METWEYLELSFWIEGGERTVHWFADPNASLPPEIQGKSRGEALNQLGANGWRLKHLDKGTLIMERRSK